MPKRPKEPTREELIAKAVSALVANPKDVEAYLELMLRGSMAFRQGIAMNPDDIRKAILKGLEE